MDKAAFVAKWSDELSGLLLGAFALASEGDGSNMVPAKIGRHMLATLKRSVTLLERIYDDKHPPKGPLTVDEIVGLFMEHYVKLGVEQHKEITEKLRKRLNPASEKKL